MIMRGRRNPEKPLGKEGLPPCRVCREPGTGFHYGVTTCGACKGFFRRSLVRPEPYVCTRNHLCQVGQGTIRRQTCPKCRYNKCIAVGMSKEACKFGRYTLVKKSKDMEEVQVANYPSPFTRPTCGEPDNNCQLTSSHSNVSSTTPQFSSRGKIHYPSVVHDSDVRSVTDLRKRETMLHCDEEENVANFQRNHNSENFSFREQKYSEGREEFYKDYEENRANNRFHDNYFFTSQCYTDNSTVEDYSMSNGPKENKKSVSDTIKESYATLSEPCFTGLETHSRFDKFPSSINSTMSNDKSSTPLLHHFDRDNLAPYASTRTVTDLSSHSKIQNSNRNNFLADLLSPNERMSPNQLNFLHRTNDNRHFLDNLSQDQQQNCKQRIIPNYSPFSPSSTICGSPKDENNPTHHNMANTVSFSPPSSTSVGTDFDTPMDLSSPRVVDNKTNDYSVFKDDRYMNNASKTITTQTSLSNFNQCLQDNNKSLNAFRIKESEDILSKPNNTIIPVNFKRCHGEDDENNDQTATTKRHCLSREADNNNSERQLTHSMCKNCIELPSNKHYRQFDHESNPLILFVCPHDPLRYAFSIYNCFPFTCYEKKALAPLLKHCYALDDDRKDKEYISSSGDQKYAHNNLNISSKSNDGNSSNSSCIPSTAQSSEWTCLYHKKMNSTFDDAEMDKIFECLQANHCQNFGPKSSFMSESDRKQALDMFWEICQLQDTLQGTMKFIDDDKYFKILETTGVDVDKRKEWFTTYLDSFDAMVTKYITFFRDIPGFLDFNLKDRITLAKSAFHIYKVLSIYKCTDIGKKIAIDEERRSATRLTTLFQILPMNTNMNSCYEDVIAHLKALDITFEEMVLVKVLVLMYSDLCEKPEEPCIVTSWHNTYLKCLHRHIVKSHGQGPQADERFQKFLKVLQKLNEMRKVIQIYNDTTAETYKRLSDGYDAPLFKEVFSKGSNRSLPVKDFV